MTEIRRVFLSHTSELRAHPAARSFIHAAEEAVTTVGDAVSDMRYFEVRDTLPARTCREKVGAADIYVLIAGFRYGSLVPDLRPQVSYTELEFDTAADLGIERLVFLIAEDAVAPGAMFLDPEHGARQVAFRAKARNGATAGTVTSPDDLKAQLIHALSQLPRPLGETTPAARRVWDIPLPVEEFTGRGDLLDHLDRTLGDSGRAVIHAVTGIGGVGKTSTAIEYAHRHSDRFDIAWWIPAENPDLVPDRLAALAHALDLTERTTPTSDAVDRLRAHLQRHGRWLLVFDNAEDPNALKPLLPAGPGQVIITSRNPHWRGTAARVEITELPRTDSVTLLRELMPGISEHDADRVADAVGDLPLALDQAGALLASGGLTIETYLRLLTEQTETLLALSTGIAYPRSAAATWAVAFDDLTTQHPATADLLTLIAWLAPEPVPLPLLFTDTESDRLDALPDTLIPFAADPLALLAAVGELARRGLVSADPAGVVLHRVPAALLRARSTTTRSDDNWATLAAHVLDAALPTGASDNPAAWPVWQQLLTHVLVAIAADRDHLAATDELLPSLLAQTARYLQARGERHPAHRLFHRAHHLRQQRLGDDHPDTLSSASHLALAMHALGEHQQARALHEDTLTRQRHILGDDHPDTLSTASNLALTLHWLGEHQHARALDEDTLTRQRNVLGDDHPDTLTSVNNLALDLDALGEHQEARGLHEEAVTHMRRVLGRDHPTTLTLANNLADNLHALGEHHQARALHEDTLTRQRRVLGDDAGDTLYTAENLVRDLRALGQYGEAERWLEWVIESRKTGLGRRGSNQ